MHLVRLLAGFVFLLLAGPALGQPEPYDSLLKRAPKLAISGAVTKLAAPLAIGGAGWGPFKRLCVSRMLIQSNGKEVPETEPSCFTVQQAREEGGTWQLDILTDPIRGGPPVAFATSRDAAGRVEDSLLGQLARLTDILPPVIGIVAVVVTIVGAFRSGALRVRPRTLHI